ncbi:MAG: DUF4252 domain-containing protein [Candidatus Latescibacteria bacterium]|nr:DUF4252 domain-containing protein [Candidatus Latescibacterota bacterium]
MQYRTRHIALALVAALSLAGAARADDNEFTALPGYVDFAPLARISEEAKVEVNLKGPMLGLVSKFVGHDDPELRDILANLKLVRVRVYDLTPEIEKEFLSAGTETTTRLDKSGWERIVRVREDNERVDIYFKPSKNAEWIDGVLIIALDNEAAFINIVGTIRPEDVGRISEHFDVGVDDHGGAKIKIESKQKTKPGQTD